MDSSGPTYPELTAGLRDRIVNQVIKTVGEVYVFEEAARRMAAHVEAEHRSGAFDALASVPELAAALTRAMHGVHEDLHLYIGPLLPSGDESGGAGNLYQDGLRTKSRTNFDFRKLEILLGNIGYMDLRSFCPARIGGETASAAMQFLGHTDALIFDLRDNGGGDSLVQYLQSYLFDKPTHTITQRYRTGRAEQTWTLPYVPGPMFIDQPVYVLISRSTFSAGEDFAYTLKQQGRAILIGEQTRGGAHPVEFFRFPDLFLEIMIPNAYSEDPISGDNWEENGVVPDIAVDAESALDVAHEQALRTLLDRQEDDEELVSFRQWALESVVARHSRPQPDATDLRRYIGRYGRSLEITVKDDCLRLAWGGRRDYALTPRADHEFEFDHGTQRASFIIEDGATRELICSDQDGNVWHLKRKDAV